MGADSVHSSDSSPATPTELNEKADFSEKHPEVTEISLDDAEDSPLKVYSPDDNDEFIDPRLKNYPIPLVAKCVDLHNDDTEPILTFRYWTLATFWVVVGCGITTFYYFKPYQLSLSSYVVQLLSWGMGSAMATYLPTRTYNTLGYKWSLNPGPWNAKEHALIVVSYWGSCYTAYGLGPLSAMELYYGRKINAGWGILFLITTQMMGYGFAGLFRDILVRPPKIYYPGVLPNVSLFNAMHKNPSVTKNSLKFFCIIATGAFVYEWFPSFIWPMLGSLPLLCYMGHGNPIAYILGSGYNGFGMLDISLDWNYISFFSPMYTPLWSNMHQIAGSALCLWFLYPIIYYTNTMNAKNYPPASTGTWDINGETYNITRILTPQFTLNQTAMNEYSKPYWSPSYAFYFFFGFCASTGAMLYSLLWYGKSSYYQIKDAFRNRRTEYDDPYLKLMEHLPRAPHWWYGVLLVVCMALALGQLYGGEMQLPWWGLILITAISAVFTFPNGILFGVANVQVGMAFISEVIAGALFPGRPEAVLTCMVYGRQILEQNLNLISDYKFGFYMKVPEKEMFWGQVYGTLLGPFINYGMMRFIIDTEGPKLTGKVASQAWDAVLTKNFYSLSVIWGILGPKNFFAGSSPYSWVYYGFIIGPAVVSIIYLLHYMKPHWQLENRFNPVMLFYGAAVFPVYQSVNFMSSALVSIFFMGYMFRYHPVWFRKYNYLLGVGMDCGTQIMQTVLTFGVDLPNAVMPNWWGNNAVAVDRCFPPGSLAPNALN